MGNGIEFYMGYGRRGDNSEYVNIGKIVTVNGIKGHIVAKRASSGSHSNLPTYSNTSDIYFRNNDNGVRQARVYIGKRMGIDFDWGHNHKNNSGDKRVFKEGTVHVQEWKWEKDGSFRRLSDDARYMNNSEMKKYGPIIKEFCPNVKFR